MRKIIAWAGRIVFGSAVVLCLGFGTQQALGFGAHEGRDTLFICDQYCPEDPDMCDECCRLFPPATGGQCSGNSCYCEL